MELKLEAPEIKEDSQKKIHRLTALVESFNSVTSSLDMRVVLIKSIETARSLINADIGSIALINETGDALHFIESTDPDFEKLKQLTIPMGKGIVGSVAQTGKSVYLIDAHNDPRFYEAIDIEMGQTTCSYLCCPLKINNKIIGTTQIMNRPGSGFFTLDDLLLLEGFANQVALAIENTRNHELQLRQKDIENEIELCAEIQKNIFPKSIPSLTGFQIYGDSAPAKEMGGDYYNYFQHNDECLDFILADVSGKGVSAGLLSLQFHTCYQLLANPRKPLEETARELNSFLCSSLTIGRFITAFIGRIRLNSNELEYILAGHPSPLLINRKSPSLQKDFVRTGPVLGFDHNSPPKTRKISFSPGELIIVYSDGYSEAQNEAGELFGEQRILQTALKNSEKSMASIHTSLNQEIKYFCNKKQLETKEILSNQRQTMTEDDMTILMIRREET